MAAFGACRRAASTSSIAWAVPRLRKSRDLDTVEAERARLERWHDQLDRSLPTKVVPGFHRRFAVVVETLTGPRASSRRTSSRRAGSTRSGPSPRPRRRLRGAAGPVPRAVRDTAGHRAAGAGGAARLPAGAPSTAGATRTRRWWTWSPAAGKPGSWCSPVTPRAAVWRSRWRCPAGPRGPQPDRLVLHSPWADLTTSTPDTPTFSERDTWLFLGKLHAYAGWWAGSPDDLGRPEVSPALACLDGLPSALMFCGTRDTLAPGCRLLAEARGGVDVDLTYVEVPDLIHVYPLLPFVPEARRAWWQTMEFLR